MVLGVFLLFGLLALFPSDTQWGANDTHTHTELHLGRLDLAVAVFTFHPRGFFSSGGSRVFNLCGLVIQDVDASSWLRNGRNSVSRWTTL